MEKENSANNTIGFKSLLLLIIGSIVGAGIFSYTGPAINIT